MYVPDLKSLYCRKVMRRKYVTAGKFLIYQLDSYSLVCAGFEYRMMVTGFASYITVQTKGKITWWKLIEKIY